MEKKFVILNNNGEEVEYSVLNQQAADLWEKEVEEGKYVYPHEVDETMSPEEVESLRKTLEENWTWCSVIEMAADGWTNSKISWKNLIRGLLFLSLGECLVDLSSPEDGYKLPEFEAASEDESQMHLPESVEKALYYTIEHYRPYVDLVNLWSSLGYSIQVL